MRRLRNNTEYPDVDRPTAGPSDVDEAIPAAAAMADAIRKVLADMPAY